MKLLSVTLFLAGVQAYPCDPKQITTKFYKDDKCTIDDEEANKVFSVVDPLDYFVYSGECEVFREEFLWDGRRISVTVDCSSEGFYEEVFLGTECDPAEAKPEAFQDWKWGECQFNSNNGAYGIMTTTQTYPDDEKDNGTQMRPLEQQFDDYYAFDEDHDMSGMDRSCAQHSDCGQDYCCAVVWGQQHGMDEGKFTKCMDTKLVDQMREEGGMMSDDMWMQMECMPETMSGANYFSLSSISSALIIGAMALI